jgi:predicted metal-dependent peptidase
MSITNKEWLEISRSLEEHHAIFYKIWQMGKPHFTNRVNTAAVQFDKEGEFVVFLFNEDFWNSLDFYNKLFVICHESLHLILNHGKRTKDSVNMLACNQCLDVVVNHLLVEKFGFKRESILNWESYCWVDTVFAEKVQLSNAETYEFYYSLFEKSFGDGGPGEGEISTVDEHAFKDDLPNKILEGMSKEEKKSLSDALQKHIGLGEGIWQALNFEVKTKKRKWETVIKKWCNAKYQSKFKEIEQWSRINRRLSGLTALDEIFIPSEMEVEHLEKNKSKIKIYFFLDTSGSCWGYKDRFFSAVSSLPSEKFDVRLFCFDTKVAEVSPKQNGKVSVYGGGGTSLAVLEETIQQHIQNGEKYPDGVFVITDGYGEAVKPEKPKNWYWFLTDYSTKKFISEECNFFNLSDFE